MSVTRICDLQAKHPRQNYRRPLPPVEPIERAAAGIDGDIPVETEALANWKCSLCGISFTIVSVVAFWAIVIPFLLCLWKGCK